MISPSTALAKLQSSLQRRDRDGVNRACRSLIAAKAPLGGQWRSIANVLIENGEFTDARRAAEILVTATGNSPLGRYVQAEVLARTGEAARAYDMLGQLPGNVPDPVSNAYMLGTLALNLGDLDAAREHLHRAVNLAPQSGQSWLALAGIGRVLEADGQRMLALRSPFTNAPEAERSAFLYALGKYLDEQDRVDDAFACFVEGARIEARLREGEASADRSVVREALSAWTAASVAELPVAPRGSGRAIFVTGLPRSGTTLVEQILAAHSGVDGGEELGIFRHVVADMGGIDLASTARALTSDRAAALIEVYDHLVVERFPGAGRVIDKTLLASRIMGPLSALMPDAPVIWMRRDPLDTAWSIFRTHFRHGLGWSFDLTQIAEEMRLEDELFAHWTQMRPDRILPVDYAELVRSPERVIPQIVAHCGLQLEDTQLRPHEASRTVTTASVAQVRQPINTRAVGAAEPYRRHLQPLIDAYRALGGTID